MRATRFLPVLALLVAFPGPQRLAGQVRLEDFVIAAGAAMERWQGDFSAITVPQIDSTDSALAGVGEWTARGRLSFFDLGQQALDVSFDAGVRQFATGGFQLRNYAPREHSGSLTGTYSRALAGGALTGEAAARIRGIADRPPMPLYLAPGYDTYTAKVGYGRALGGLDLIVAVTGEAADYAAPKALPALDLLDRSSVIVRTDAIREFRDETGNPDNFSQFGLFTAYRYHSYPKQGLGVLRADHAYGAGVSYEMQSDRLTVALSLDGTLSRSNSRRVEYNAVALEADLSWELGLDTQIDVRGVLARKRYRNPAHDALVPGEEADNASVLYTEITRHLSEDVSGSFRFGWQKVETNISGAYYTRFGGSFFLRIRPGF